MCTLNDKYVFGLESGISFFKKRVIRTADQISVGMGYDAAINKV